MNNKFLICVVGPTAIGKTKLGIELARHFGTEIISADSRQFYKEMRIGTAVPNHAELAAVPHHFIQHKSVEEYYSVGDFERDALEKLEALFSTHNMVIMVGGSGLYVNAVTEGLDYFPEVDPKIRKSLNQDLKKNGLSELQKQLEKLDPVYFSEMDRENPHRLIRALEICIGTGKPYSSFRNKKKPHRTFKTIFIGLTAEREIIYDRINQRVDSMLKEGLLQEAGKLYGKKHLNALNTVGYKELFSYFEDQLTLEKATEEIKKNTRRFAKRQLTWFRKNDKILWFEPSDSSTEIIEKVEDQIKNQ